MKKRYRLFAFTLIGVVILFAGIAWATTGSFVRRHLFTHTYRVVNGAPFNINVNNWPVLGKANAPVTIVEFGDFKCPTCKAWEQQIFPKLQKQFISTGQAKMYFKTYLVIPQSTDAAMAGLSIYQQSPSAFWQFYSAIYQHQQNERLNWATPAFLQRFITEYVPGVSVSKVMTNVKNQTELPAINAARSQAKMTLVSATPTIFIDGYKLDNPFNYASIVKLITHEEQKAEVQSE